jgi:predicted dithiol-disulfide oxidoreductase (DUF899 family)
MTSSEDNDQATVTRGDGTAAPAVVERADFDSQLDQQVAVEKELTRFGDRVSARRRRLPMTPIDDYTFVGGHGPERLGDLFGGRPQLVLQAFMFHPDWDEGCPSCTWAANNLPIKLDQLLEPNGVSFAMVSRAPIDQLQSWKQRQGWDHLTWVSSAGTSFNTDWGWTVDGNDQPGYMYLLRTGGGIFVTYLTRRRGTEAILSIPAIWDRTIYGRQQDYEDSPDGWPQRPTYA